MHRAAGRATSLTFLLLMPTSIGMAQRSVITGQVRDTSGKPVVAAQALLVAAKKHDQTNQGGWFVFDSIEAGPDVLVVRAMGYRLQRAAINLGDRDTLEVEVRLIPQPQLLPELSVTVEGRKLTGVAAEAAQRMLRNGAPTSGLITREDIETWGPHDLSAPLLRAGMILQDGQMFCSSRGGKGMTVYIDGTRWSDTTFFDVRAIPPAFVEAIEVYRSVSTRPVEFNMTASTGCLLLIWTRR
jgi:hypothetical protein